MKILKDEACKIAENFALQSFKGKLELSGARFVEAPIGQWGTSDGEIHGEWKVIFRKIVDNSILAEPHLIVVFVDAVTGETAKFPMI